jgi:hypothetical protein
VFDRFVIGVAGGCAVWDASRPLVQRAPELEVEPRVLSIRDAVFKAMHQNPNSHSFMSLFKYTPLHSRPDSTDKTRYKPFHLLKLKLSASAKGGAQFKAGGGGGAAGAKDSGLFVTEHERSTLVLARPMCKTHEDEEGGLCFVNTHREAVSSNPFFPNCENGQFYRVVFGACCVPALVRCAVLCSRLMCCAVMCDV